MMDVTKLRADLERDEGIRLKPYRDTVGVLTIGIGRNLEGNGITREEALYLLDNDIVRVCRLLDAALPWWRTLDDVRARAVANMAFQLGVHGLMGFRKMLGALQQGFWQAAAEEALDSTWAKQTPARAHRIAEMLRNGE